MTDRRTFLTALSCRMQASFEDNAGAGPAAGHQEDWSRKRAIYEREKADKERQRIDSFEPLKGLETPRLSRP